MKTELLQPVMKTELLQPQFREWFKYKLVTITNASPSSGTSLVHASVGLVLHHPRAIIHASIPWWLPKIKEQTGDERGS
jgi:hypothetical protein